MCMNRLGFTYKETLHMYFGFFIDLFEVYKRNYNFEKNNHLYVIDVVEEKKVTSLTEL